MYKNIVVGTDGSETAALAVAHALGLAKAGNGTLHIVHAFQNVSLGMAAVSAGSGGPAVDLDRLNTSLSDNGNAVVGAAVAAHVQPLRLDDGVLVVGVDDPAWATQIQLLEASVRESLGRIAGVQVDRLEVRVQRRR